MTFGWKGDEEGPRPGQSINDYMEERSRKHRDAIEAGRKKPDKLSIFHGKLETCPECGASAVGKMIGGFPIGMDSKRSLPDPEGIITVTCRICEHVWQEDDMVQKMVNETKIS